MGSFNVACSVSNLSINCGDKVKFIPLLPNNFHGNESHLVGVQHFLIYPNCYFNPLCLPISGVYNDYGSIDEILIDDNVKAIEKKFNMNINDFIESITFGNKKKDKDNLLENVSGMFILESVYDKLVDYNLKEKNSKLAGYLTEEIAISFGFRKVSNEEQFLFDSYHPNLYRKEGFPYDLKIGNYGADLINGKYKEYYNFGDKRYGKQILYYWDKATKTNAEETFPKVKDIDNLTDKEYAEIKRTFKTLVGAGIGYNQKAKDKHSVYSTKTFVECWEKTTGEKLDTEFLQKENVFSVQYDSFRNKIIENIEPRKKELKMYEEMLLKVSDKDKEIIEHLIKLNKERELINYNLRGHKFIGFFRDWNFFEELYIQPILDGKLKKEFSRYKAFYWAMYNCNRFYFPAMNGEQSGDDEASKMLLDISTEIINKRLEKKECDE